MVAVEGKKYLIYVAVVAVFSEYLYNVPSSAQSAVSGNLSLQRLRSNMGNIMLNSLEIYLFAYLWRRSTYGRPTAAMFGGDQSPDRPTTSCCETLSLTGMHELPLNGCKSTLKKAIFNRRGAREEGGSPRSGVRWNPW